MPVNRSWANDLPRKLATHEGIASVSAIIRVPVEWNEDQRDAALTALGGLTTELRNAMASYLANNAPAGVEFSIGLNHR